MLLLPRRLPGGTRRGSFIAVRSEEEREAASEVGNASTCCCSFCCSFFCEKFTRFSFFFLSLLPLLFSFALSSLFSLSFSLFNPVNSDVFLTSFVDVVTASRANKQNFKAVLCSFVLLPFSLSFFSSSFSFQLSPSSNPHRPRQKVVDGQVRVPVRHGLRVLGDEELSA